MTKIKEVENSSLKKAGVKSIFVVGESYVITSFGKGNESEHELKITGEEQEDISTNGSKFTLKVEEKYFEIKDRKKQKHIADKPIDFKKSKDPIMVVKQDAIRAKDELEKHYFGQTFNDNIHIQLIYNILDIKKIMSYHIADMVFSINNLRRIDVSEENDYLGEMDYSKDFNRILSHDNDKNKTLIAIDKDNNKKESDKSKGEKFIAYRNEIDSRRKYFARIFNDFENKISDESIYNALKVVGMLRQWSTHGTSSENKKINLFDERFELNAPIIESRTKEKIDEINSNFVKDVAQLDKKDKKHNNNNMAVIYYIYDVNTFEEKQRYLDDFYEFVVKKENRNFGFSAKKIREIIVDTYRRTELGSEIAQMKYDTVRGKLYRILDFMLFLEYKNDQEERENICEKLRSSEKANLELKHDIYVQATNKILKKIESKIPKLLTGMNEIQNEFSSIFKTLKNSPTAVSHSVLIDASKYSQFSKMIYFMTFLLDGKEINDLLTGLINKFEVINTNVVDIKSQYQYKLNILQEYSLFNNAKGISNQLKIIKNIANMENDNLAQDGHYIDAVNILGSDLTDQEIVNLLANQNSGNWDKNMRNFIGSTVIDSNRFLYVAKYLNCKKAKVFMSNKQVIKFVLNRIPTDQLMKYCDIIKTSLNDNNKDTIVERLAEKLINVNFESFKEVQQNPKSDGQAAFKEMSTKIIKLYLTICFVLVKNLMNVNARYIIAFSKLEMDYQLHFKKKFPIIGGARVESYIKLTELFIANSEKDGYWLKNKAVNRIKQNLRKDEDSIDSCGSNYDAFYTHQFRNAVVHFNAITSADDCISRLDENTKITSYFGIFHYLMQSYLYAVWQKDEVYNLKNPTEKVRSVPNDEIKNRLQNVFNHRTYNKDLVKILNLPFAYNTARFVNLSMENKFDMHDVELPIKNK